MPPLQFSDAGRRLHRRRWWAACDGRQGHGHMERAYSDRQPRNCQSRHSSGPRAPGKVSTGQLVFVGSNGGLYVAWWPSGASQQQDMKGPVLVSPPGLSVAGGAVSAHNQVCSLLFQAHVVFLELLENFIGTDASQSAGLKSTCSAAASLTQSLTSA